MPSFRIAHIDNVDQLSLRRRLILVSEKSLHVPITNKFYYEAVHGVSVVVVVEKMENNCGRLN